MTNSTQEIRTAELIQEIKAHPHKEELIQLMFEQVADDTEVVKPARRSEDKAIYEDIKLDEFYKKQWLNTVD
tara:strand:+ start:53 stop:268 length:216 start_codon:yes stop_codon:yes gene_type:complete